MRESTLEEWAVALAKKNGWLVRKVSWIGRTGAPDRMFAKGGRIVFVEFKAPGKRPSLMQQREHKRMKSAGIWVVVIDRVEVAKNWFGDGCEV